MVSTSLAKKICVATAMCGMLSLPGAAWAQTQSGIAGVVKDTSGAVLPGVTVEAASPVLIEKVRTVVTDEQGQYKIIDLRPGTYSVTFTLPGFSTLKRDGLELTTDFTATVNAEMKVGALSETITVSGQTPVVDVQSVMQERVITSANLESLPTAKSIQSIAALIPGLQAGINQDVGGTSGDFPLGVAIHGGRGIDQHIFYDSMRTNNLNTTGGGGGASQSIFFNPASISEISMETGNLAIQSDTGSIVINTIPKDGGNRFTAEFIANGTNSSFQSNNLSADLQAQGVTSVTRIRDIFDVDGALGGPVVKNRLWFYTAQRRWGNQNYVAGDYFSNNPLGWTPSPDLSRPAIDQNFHLSTNARLTWQVDQKNKITLALERQNQCLCYTGVPGSWSPTNASPEAATYVHNFPSSYGQLKWSDTASNKLLLEAGVSYNVMNWQTRLEPGVGTNVISVSELSTGETYRAPASISGTHQNQSAHPRSAFGLFNLAYVTGSHALRVGTTVMNGRPYTDTFINGDQTYQFLNGHPVAVVLHNTPLALQNELKADVGTYAQDQWTLKRMTLNLGLRFEYLNAEVPAQSMPAGTFVPARNYPAVPDVATWEDLMPRLGAIYDLFGTGKTALKVSVNKYVNGEAVGIANALNPLNTIVSTATRSWTDSNGNDTPDCNLLVPAANGECGPISDTNFGTTSKKSTTYDPSYLHGYGKRGYNWETSVGIQQQLRPGVSVSAGFFRRSYGNYVITKNLDLTPSNYDPFCITAPIDPRLPGGGGNQLCGFYDVNPSKFGQVNNFVTSASSYGGMSDVYTGVDLTLNARFKQGATLQGGLNTGHEVTDMCNVIGNVDTPAATLPLSIVNFPYSGLGLPSLSGLPAPDKAFCHIDPPFWLPDVKLSGTYPLPWNLQVAGTFQSIAGPPIVATDVVPSSQIAPSLGRPLAAGPNSTATLQLVAPGTLFANRLDQLDFRVTKNIKVQRLRIRIMADVYNVFNSSAVLALNTRYGPSWQQPFVTLQGRFFKAGLQADF